MGLPTIGTLWIGRELSWLEQLCLQSFLDHGHEVYLYSYEEVKNVPPGIQTVNAAEIFPAAKIVRHARTGSPAYHADIFRLHMLNMTNHIWADTDAFCCKPWHVNQNAHFHGWISDPKPLVNNGVLGLPKASATLAAMLEFTADEYPIPPWFSPKKQTELLELKRNGEGVHVSMLPWGVWGPNALTWFLNETGEIKHSLPGRALYPLPFSKAGHSLNKNRTEQVKALVVDDTLSVHFWGRRFRNIAAKYNGVPDEGTYVSELLKIHNINPQKTANMMQLPKTKSKKKSKLMFQPVLIFRCSTIPMSLT